MTIFDGRHDLSEDSASISFRKRMIVVVDVIVQLSTVGKLHHQNDLVFVLKYWNVQELN